MSGIINPQGTESRLLQWHFGVKAGLKSLEELRSGRIRLGDIIISIDDDPVKNFDDLATILDRHNVGDRIKLGLRRNNKERTIKITLQAVN